MSDQSMDTTLRFVAAAAAGLATAVALRALADRLPRRPPYSFSGRTVLITGGARGLGLALARRFADEGARLVLVSRSGDQLARAAAELRANGTAVDVRICDVRDRRRVAALIQDVVETTGRLDVLVNNAGTIQMTPFDHATIEDFQSSLDIHFWAPLHLIREALPHLERVGGRIVNISSIGGRIAMPHLLPYAVGKFALAGLSEGLHSELSRRGVHVLTVTPGLMRTGSHRNVVVRGRHEAEARWFGLATATRFTAMSVERAANEIVHACAAGHARITPGLQARAGELIHAIAPEGMAAALRAVARLLPQPGEGPEAAALRRSRDLDLGWMARLMPTHAAVAMNQVVAPDEHAGRGAGRTFH